MTPTIQKYQQALEAVEKAAEQISFLHKQNKALYASLHDFVKSFTPEEAEKIGIFNTWKNATIVLEKCKEPFVSSFTASPVDVTAAKKKHKEMDEWFYKQNLSLKEAITNSTMMHTIKHRWSICTADEKESYFTKYNKLNR